MSLGHQPQNNAVTLAPPVVPAVRVPAPAADVIYPDSDGKPLAEGTAQYFALTGTVDKLRGRYLARPDVAVIGNMLLYYEEGNPQVSVAPDVFVVFGVEARPRSSYLLWKEGKAPDFVLEVASDSTWQEDAHRKRDLYARLGVAEYWRFDPTPDSRLLQPPLVGERLAAGAYAALPVRCHGAQEWRGASAVLGLEFRAAGGQLELFDPETETLLLDYLGQRVEAQTARVEAQTAREEMQSIRELLQLAERRVQSLEEENRRLRGTKPKAV